MLKTEFYLCEHCGNLIHMIHNSGVPIICCGEKMIKLEAKTADSATEKHVPVIEMNGQEITVTIGSTLHPMVEAHYIQWIYLETTHGGQIHYFKPGDQPVARFELASEERVLGAFEYCNLHGLWKNEL